MLDWVTGASRSPPGTDSNPEDAPETPAHVFAARAFKSLLFGTPAPNDLTVEKTKKTTKSLSKPPRRHSSDVPREKSTRPDSFISPSKGILVAPGSVSTKRKSVTFGSLGRDSNGRRLFRQSTKVDQEEEIPIPTLKPFNFDPDSIEEDLRKSLFSSHGSTHTQDEEKDQVGSEIEGDIHKVENNAVSVILAIETPTSEAIPPTERKSRFIEDQTIDLDQPRSTSGQHWKREYERDHDKSKSEMKKLIRYSQMTKSYAEKRDRDATIVSQKLEEAESKARSLETQIRKLAAQLMDAKTHGEEQDLILSEVASQTAEVMRQKGNAEKYRAALRKFEMAEPNMEHDSDKNDHTTSAAEVVELRSELLRVRLDVDRAEARAAKAEYDKSLTDTKLQKVEKSNKELLNQYEKLQDRLSKRASRLLDENRILSNDLLKSRLECSSLKEELENLKKAEKDSRTSNYVHVKDKFIDSTHPRFTKEPSPPTSDEDLREKDRAASRLIQHKSDPVLAEESDNTFSYSRSSSTRRSPHEKSISSPYNIPVPSRNAARLDGQTHQQSSLQAILALDSELDRELDDGKTTNIDGQSFQKSSPLMKSFVDNLGSRRVLPAERVAAAKKRLEEKAADRRSTPMYTRVHDKIIV